MPSFLFLSSAYRKQLFPCKGFSATIRSYEELRARRRPVVGIPGRRRTAVLQLLARREARGEESPSVREVARAAGYRSPKGGHAVLTALEGDGYIERGAALSRKRRPVRLTQKGWEAVGAAAPLLGRVAAGRGLEAIALEEPFSLFAEVLGVGSSGARRFVLRAQGDSMTGDGIEEGDFLVLEENPSPPDGSRVVAEILTAGEASPEGTVKVLRREGEMVRLEPRGGAGHEDIVVPAKRVRVRGTVEWVIKPMKGRG